MQNLQSETPYKFKKSYGGTPEPQTPQDAPWLRGPSQKKKKKLISGLPFRATAPASTGINRAPLTERWRGTTAPSLSSTRPGTL
jgi:hypothetical protein